MTATAITIAAWCPESRRFGLAAATTGCGGAAPRLVAHPWRGLVHSLARDLASVPLAESLLDKGWRGEALLARLEGSDGPADAVWTLDTQGRFAMRIGKMAQRSFYRASRGPVQAMSLGHGSAAAAFGMLDGFEATEAESLPERLLRALEAGARACSIAAESAFIRVMDPAIEYAYTDVTVDIHAQPLVELRRAHDWLAPLYDYYAIRGNDPTVARYPQWLAQRGIERK